MEELFSQSGKTHLQQQQNQKSKDLLFFSRGSTRANISFSSLFLFIFIHWKKEDYFKKRARERKRKRTFTRARDRAKRENRVRDDA
jgi:hypothetical protein